MAKNAAAVAKNFRATATTMQRDQRKAIEASALAAKTALLAAPGAPKFLRGVGRKGARVGVRYDVKGVGNPTALVRWFGPAHLVNNPTKAHTIAPRGRTRRRGNAMALNTPDGPRAKANHPGTRGKRFFQKIGRAHV